MILTILIFISFLITMFFVRKEYNYYLDKKEMMEHKILPESEFYAANYGRKYLIRSMIAFGIFFVFWAIISIILSSIGN